MMSPQVQKRPLVMGILNVTPDSFSDGGLFFDVGKAVAHGLQMVTDGADIIDVGGESTRPGSDSVDEDEELGRVIPVIRAISQKSDVLISVDTVKPSVAKEAVKSGAQLINDVSMLREGDGLAKVAAALGAKLLIMHSRKMPRDMQRGVSYKDVVKEVKDELMQAAQRAVDAGLDHSRIWLDPGIGFAKLTEHNLDLLAQLKKIVALGYPVLVGPSRKSFIGQITGADVTSRLGGTAAAVTASILGGAAAVRVHDVRIMRQVVDVAAAIAERGFSAPIDGDHV